jgi:hypothetical protein
MYRVHPHHEKYPTLANALALDQYKVIGSERLDTEPYELTLEAVLKLPMCAKSKAYTAYATDQSFAPCFYQFMSDAKVSGYKAARNGH